MSVGVASVNKVVLKQMCALVGFLCEIVILVPGHEQDKVYDERHMPGKKITSGTN